MTDPVIPPSPDCGSDPTCPACYAEHQATIACYCDPYERGRRDATTSITTWLRTQDRDTLWSIAADAIDRGEHEAKSLSQPAAQGKPEPDSFPCDACGVPIYTDTTLYHRCALPLGHDGEHERNQP